MTAMTAIKSINKRLRVEYSKDEGETWNVWAHFNPNQNVQCYKTCSRLRNCYPQWTFRVMKPEKT